MNLNNKSTRLLKNIAYIFLGSVGVKIVQILMIPFYTRCFQPEEIGIIDLLTIYPAMLIAVCVCDIYDSVFIFPHGKAPSVQRAYFSTGLLFGIASLGITAGLAAAVSLIRARFGLDGIFFRYIWVIWLVLFATFLQNYIQQFARGSDRMLVYVLCGFVHAVTLAGLALFLIPRCGINGYIFAMVAAPLIAAVFGFSAGRMYRFFSFLSFRGEFLKAMLRFSVPLIPATFLWWLINSSNRPIIENFYGLAAVGIFAIAAKVPGIMGLMYAIFQNAWQISVVEEFRTPDFEQYYNTIFYHLYTFLTLFSCTVAVFSRPIIRIFTTPPFYEAWQYIPVLTLSIVFSNGAGFVGTNFTARKEGRYFFYSSIICMIMCVILNFLLIPLFSLWGCTASICLSCLILFLSRVYYAWRFVHFTRISRLLGLLILNLSFIALVLYVEKFWINFSVLALVAMSLLFLNRGSIFELLHRYPILQNKLREHTTH